MSANNELRDAKEVRSIAPDRRFEVRISTVCLVVAMVALAGALLLSRIANAFRIGPFDVPILLLASGIFPVMACIGTISALVLSVRFRGVQFVLEVVTGAGLRALFAFWAETP